MPLPLALRRSLQRAYAKDFGRELNDDDADALGGALIRVLAPVFVNRATIHRSEVDGLANKRDAGGNDVPPV